MVHVEDFTKEEEKPTLVAVSFPKREFPDNDIWGFDAPPKEERGGIVVATEIYCRECERWDAVIEKQWIGGLGYIRMLVCDHCHFWKRRV